MSTRCPERAGQLLPTAELFPVFIFFLLLEFLFSQMSNPWMIADRLSWFHNLLGHTTIHVLIEPPTDGRLIKPGILLESTQIH